MQPPSSQPGAVTRSRRLRKATVSTRRRTPQRPAGKTAVVGERDPSRIAPLRAACSVSVSRRAARPQDGEHRDQVGDGQGACRTDLADQLEIDQECQRGRQHGQCKHRRHHRHVGQLRRREKQQQRQQGDGRAELAAGDGYSTPVPASGGAWQSCREHVRYPTAARQSGRDRQQRQHTHRAESPTSTTAENPGTTPRPRTVRVARHIPETDQRGEDPGPSP